MAGLPWLKTATQDQFCEGRRAWFGGLGFVGALVAAAAVSYCRRTAVGRNVCFSFWLQLSSTAHSMYCAKLFASRAAAAGTVTRAWRLISASLLRTGPSAHQQSVDTHIKQQDSATRAAPRPALPPPAPAFRRPPLPTQAMPSIWRVKGATLSLSNAIAEYGVEKQWLKEAGLEFRMVSNRVTK